MDQLALFVANGRLAQETADRIVRAAGAPPPPTGPAAAVPTAGSGTYAAYLAWRASEDGGRAFAWVEEMALTQLDHGAERVSPRTLVARARDRLRVPINDHFTPWIADDLVAAHPALLDVVERRRRRKAKA